MRFLLAVMAGSLLLAPGATASTGAGPSAPPASAAIRQVLAAQVAGWNRGDLIAYMNGFQRSGQTQFLGVGGILLGWEAVREHYARSYPDRATMGRLTYSGVQVEMLCADAAYVVGHYRLDRARDHPQGVFTLLLRRLPEGWRIVSNHVNATTAP